MDTTHEWIVQRTGIEARRFADEGVGSSDLAVPAAEQAIKNAGLDEKDIDMIVFATLSPDHVFPGSGVFLQRKLGLCDMGRFVRPRSTFAISAPGSCMGSRRGTGFVRSRHPYKNVLVVGAETHSAALDLSTGGRQVASLFGDGAGAVVVSATDEDRGRATRVSRGGWASAEVLCSEGLGHLASARSSRKNEHGVGQVSPEHDVRHAWTASWSFATRSSA